MNYKKILFALLISISFFVTTLKAQEKFIDIAMLEMRFNAAYTGSIGWGDVYKCEVKEVLKGNQEDSVVILYIAVNNFDSIFNMREVYSRKRKVIPVLQLRGTFKQVENDKPYVNFQNAFIDKKQRTWVLTELKREN
jgi:hypothetical protein